MSSATRFDTKVHYQGFYQRQKACRSSRYFRRHSPSLLSRVALLFQRRVQTPVNNTYKTLFLIKSLMTATSCRNMKDFTPDMKCFVIYFILIVISEFCWFLKTQSSWHFVENGNGVRFSAEVRDFSLLQNLQTCCEAAYSTCNGVLSKG